MTSRERVLAAISHREPDRVPRDLGGTESSGMTAYALNRLQDHLDVKRQATIFEPYQYVAYIPEGIKARFRIDTANLTPGPKSWKKALNPLGLEVLLPERWNEEPCEEGGTAVRGADGTIAARRPKDGYYFDPVNPPLQSVTKAADIARHKKTVSAFDYPSFADEEVENMQERMQTMNAEGECVVFNLCCHILAAGQLLRGYENFMVDLLTDEPMVRTLLDILIEAYCRRIDQLAPQLKSGIDVVLLNDDLGTQNGPMLAPQLYRGLIKPYQKTLFAHVKQAFETPILFHSCGSVREFIPDLIEAGADALNPIQLSAEGMELKGLKADFGSDLTFWGGGIDTQSVLNKASPSEVKDAVKRSVDILAPGGGFVFCQVHNIQPDVPPENVTAMFEALDACGAY